MQEKPNISKTNHGAEPIPETPSEGLPFLRKPLTAEAITSSTFREYMDKLDKARKEEQEEDNNHNNPGQEGRKLLK